MKTRPGQRRGWAEMDVTTVNKLREEQSMSADWSALSINNPIPLGVLVTGLWAYVVLRFTCLCRGMLAWLERQPWQPEIIHCHDWQTALVPAIIGAGQVRRAATLLTIHNLAYQGLFPAEQFEVTGLPPSMYTMAGLEFWGQVNLLKGGLVFADLLNTVSETYAQEIQTAEFGAGLDGVLRDRSRDLFGILNGVDYGVWDPAHDPLIPARYTADDLSGKRACKDRLQDEFGLAADPDIPLIGMVTRSSSTGASCLWW